MWYPVLSSYILTIMWLFESFIFLFLVWCSVIFLIMTPRKRSGDGTGGLLAWQQLHDSPPSAWWNELSGGSSVPERRGNVCAYQWHTGTHYGSKAWVMNTGNVPISLLPAVWADPINHTANFNLIRSSFTTTKKILPFFYCVNSSCKIHINQHIWFG